MSNTMFIRAVEVRNLGEDNPSYGIVINDTYGNYTELDYDTPEALFATYKTRLELVILAFSLDEFVGSGEVVDVENGVVLLDCVSHIVFEGIAEDDSIKSMTKGV